MSLSEANIERHNEIVKKVEKVIKDCFPEAFETDSSSIPYVFVLPEKYARYYKIINPNTPAFSAKGKASLQKLQRHLKEVSKILNNLPAVERRTLNEKFDFRAGLGIYAAATIDLTCAANRTIQDIHLSKGRKKNPYYGLVAEMGRDFQCVTGNAPRLSRNPCNNKPTGKFYSFVKGMFEALGLNYKANIEEAIKALQTDEVTV